MNTVEWIMYRNVLSDYLLSDEGKLLSTERKATFWKELDMVNAKINSLMNLYNTNEQTIENYNPEQEIL